MSPHQWSTSAQNPPDVCKRAFTQGSWLGMRTSAGRTTLPSWLLESRWSSPLPAQDVTENLQQETNAPRMKETRIDSRPWHAPRVMIQKLYICKRSLTSHIRTVHGGRFLATCEHPDCKEKTLLSSAKKYSKYLRVAHGTTTAAESKLYFPKWDKALLHQIPKSTKLNHTLEFGTKTSFFGQH